MNALRAPLTALPVPKGMCRLFLLRWPVNRRKPSSLVGQLELQGSRGPCWSG
jgi:hypothetical protein